MARSIDIREEDGVRSLHFGSHWVQGAMRIARPYALELEYTREMLLPLLLRRGPRWPRHVLQIGLGAASLTRFLYRHRPRARLTIVEIDERVVAAARQFFRLPDDPARVAIEIGDGCDYVAGRARAFDLILVDGFDARGSAGALELLPFYCNARARLTDRGVLAANLLTRSRGGAPGLGRLREAFEGRVRALAPCCGGNTIVLAASGEVVDLGLDTLGERAAALKRDTGLDLRPTLSRLPALPGAPGDRFVL